MATKTKKTKNKPAPKTEAVPADVQAIVQSPRTMQALLDGYVAYLEHAGRASGTVFSYRMEMETALAELGAETPLDVITEDWIARYFECDRVLKSKTGAPKSKLTIDKSRRVLRLAFDWAVSEGWIATAPVPAAYRVALPSAA